MYRDWLKGECVIKIKYPLLNYTYPELPLDPGESEKIIYQLKEPLLVNKHILKQTNFQ